MTTERILVTVKTHPTPSSSNDETVCTAGINLCTGKFVRLYPVRWRFLPAAGQFRKWDIIEADIKPPRSATDRRGDTFTPHPDSIRIVDHLKAGSAKNWARRNGYVLPLVSSLEELNERAASYQGSLGVVKVQPGARLVARAEDPEWDEKQRAIVERKALFGRQVAPLQKPPWSYHYIFRCSAECTCEHDLQVFDWEPHELYRQQAKKKSPDDALKDVLANYNVRYGAEARDVHLFVGTTISRQTQFSVVGVYYPPFEARGA